MLERIENESIRTEERTIDLPDGGSIYTKIIRHRTNRGAGFGLAVHGSGSVGNHTIVERSARWLVDRGLFDAMVLPDRRGCGRSTNWDHPPTLRDQAKDMAHVLDAFDGADWTTAIGLSYGGPIVLTLAGIDSRVRRVVLLGSSPTLAQIAWPWRWLIKIGLVPWIMRRVYRREIGIDEPRDIDFDFMYEWTNPSRAERWEQFKRVLRHTPKERLESVLHEITATLDPKNAEIPADVHVDVPVYQIIGSKDETWGRDVPERLRHRIPHLRRRIIDGADHAAVLTRADEFHEALAEMLRDSADPVASV